ncbi:hypothetical protein ACP275_04G181400 [Erythranthe tilingii]
MGLNHHYKVLLLALSIVLLWQSTNASEATKGRWDTLLNSTGVVAMHMALTHHNTVIMFDQTGQGPTGYRLPARRNGPRRYAHSVEYDLSRNIIRPIEIESDTLCSSGSILSNGSLIQTGGFGSGSRRIRFFRSCGNGRCDWREERNHLSEDRWFASNLRLPENDDRVIVLGGDNVFSYEFVPKRVPNERPFNLPFLHNTYERNEGGNNLYPIIHLASDGNLFIFANRDSILLDYKRDKVVKTYPRIPGRGSRSYPSSGSSVILPLSHKNNFDEVEVMICGGAAYGALAAAQRGNFLAAKRTCGRMVITGHHHRWEMESMPGPRVMNDMIVLPNGNILIINGARHGCSGSNYGSNPSLVPYLYKPKRPTGSRFTTLASTRIARMYHSSAVLLPDGRVLVAGSNPNHRYAFGDVPHPTELRLQAFSPANMARDFDHRRARNVTVKGPRNEEWVGYGEEFGVEFSLNEKVRRNNNDDQVVFTAYAPPFNTHGMSMNQRLLVLRCNKMVRGDGGLWRANVVAPPSQKVAPAGYYMITVVNGGIPSRSHWIRFIHV